MNEDSQPGTWHIASEPGEATTIRDREKRPIATLAEAPEHLVLARASLIMAAPELYETVACTLDLFQAMAQHGSGKWAQAAGEMIPLLESALGGATFMGPITPEVLGAG